MPCVYMACVATQMGCVATHHSTWMRVWTFVCMYVYVYVYVYVCMIESVIMCMCMCMRTCMRVRTRMCMCMYNPHGMLIAWTCDALCADSGVMYSNDPSIHTDTIASSHTSHTHAHDTSGPKFGRVIIPHDGDEIQICHLATSAQHTVAVTSERGCVVTCAARARCTFVHRHVQHRHALYGM